MRDIDEVCVGYWNWDVGVRCFLYIMLLSAGVLL